VNLFVNVVPKLNSGVVIPIHDIFLPFEYPREWVIENKLNVNWTEQYLGKLCCRDPISSRYVARPFRLENSAEVLRLFPPRA
jgi:hypothetical protein